jgi:UTP--glucose-1-phosphate uridylyltransferase
VAAERGALPKECLEVAGIPMIGFALLELAIAGCREVAVVVSPDKEGLRQRLTALPPFPAATVRRFFPAETRDASAWPRVVFFEQPSPRGVVHALACARSYLEGEPFALVMPDNLLAEDRAPMAVLDEAFERHGLPVLGVIEIDGDAALRVGNCGRVTLEDPSLGESLVSHVAEKRVGVLALRGGETALRGVGRSIVPPSFVELPPGWETASLEIDDVPKFQALAAKRTLLGVRLRAALFDLGQPAGLAAARSVFG